MIDFNKKLRKAYYECLSGNITYQVTEIPVFDQKVKKGSTNDNYIILSNITSNNQDTFCTFDRDISLTVDIVTKTYDSVTSSIADHIAGQVLALVLPSPAQHGLPAQSGVQFANVRLDSDRTLETTLSATSLTVRRLLTFRQLVSQL